MNNAQQHCPHCSKFARGEYKYIMRAVVHPCCFVHSKQYTSPASLRGDITVRHIVHYVGMQQNQKQANDNILHTHPKTDGVEMEWESAWHRLRSASQSNYSLILWKLPKCWPLGKTPWLAVTLHRMCIITVITSSFEIGWGAVRKACLSALLFSFAVACGWCVPSLWTQSFWQRRS